jgi:hypothetical protein
VADIEEVLAAALGGDNSCASCGGSVPVSARGVNLVHALFSAGRLDGVDPEGVRMLILLGSLDAGCGLARVPRFGRMRASCPACATAPELEMAARLRLADA